MSVLMGYVILALPYSFEVGDMMYTRFFYRVFGFVWGVVRVTLGICMAGGVSCVFFFGRMVFCEVTFNFMWDVFYVFTFEGDLFAGYVVRISVGGGSTFIRQF